MNRIKTPCIGLCSTVYGDAVCRGCKRYDDEIIAWNGYDEARKGAVMQRLDGWLAQAMRDRCEVVDVERLLAGAKVLGVHGGSRAFVHHCAYEVIRRGVRVITALEDYGIRLLPAVASLPLDELRDLLDQAVFQLAVQASTA